MARRFAFSAVFDTNRGKTPGAAAGSVSAVGNQFAEAGVRFEIVNQRQSGSRRFDQALADWQREAASSGLIQNRLQGRIINLRATRARAMVAKLNELKKDGKTDPEIAKELQELLQECERESRADIESAIPGLLEKARRGWFDTLRADNRLFNAAAHGWVVTAEYALTKPDIATEAISTIVPKGTRPPSLHSGRLIAAWGLLRHRIDFTLNASSSWFADKRPGMTESWRDAQFSGTAKILLRPVTGHGAPALSFAGPWMYLNQRPLGIDIPAFNRTKVNQPGSIRLFQTKLELPTANAAVKIPISFTYSNRTDLIKENDVRAQIGFSLNLDALFSGQTP